MRTLKPRPPTDFAAGALPLDAGDHALIAAAHAQLRRLYLPLWHTVAAALLGADGQVWTGIHLGATVGRLSVCAEAVALGRALVEGATHPATVVAVRHPKPDETDREPAIVSPCGACREMFCDHAPDVMVIVPGAAGPEKWPLRSLLPLPYRR